MCPGSAMIRWVSLSNLPLSWGLSARRGSCRLSVPFQMIPPHLHLPFSQESISRRAGVPCSCLQLGEVLEQILQIHLHAFHLSMCTGLNVPAGDLQQFCSPEPQPAAEDCLPWTKLLRQEPAPAAWSCFGARTGRKIITLNVMHILMFNFH